MKKLMNLQDRLRQLESSPGNKSAYSKNTGNSAPPASFTSDVSIITSTVTSLLKEEREREERKLNILINGIPESTTESPTDRKAHDIKQVSEIFSELLEVKTTVEEAVRLGKRDSSRKRLIKVSVSSLAVKTAVLRNNFKLRSKSDPDWVKRVFITPDLTPKEQIESGELRKRLAEVNGSGKAYRIKTD